MINFPNGSSCFAYDPMERNTVYIGSSSLNESKDGGKTWERIFPKQNEIVSETYGGDHAGYRIEVTETSIYPKDAPGIHVIRIDPASSDFIYIAMGRYFLYSTDRGKSWGKKDCGNRIDQLYTNLSRLKDEVYIFTEEAILVFNKKTQQVNRRNIPGAMLPASSYAAGCMKEADQVVFYAVHHTKPKDNPFAFTTSELWVSNDYGTNWEVVNDPVVTGTSGIKPCFTMIACSEEDAANAYLVTNMYEEIIDGKSIYWYGAIKTADAGKRWSWAFKGGGGSGQYGVQDAHDAENLQDSWVHHAFGGEFIQLMDVGVSPKDGHIAIVTDWYRTMKTMDGGKSWKEIYSKEQPNGTYTSRGMDVTTTYGVHFDPFDDKHIAISYTDIGYHHSFDGGESWTRSVKGVPVKWVNTCYWAVFDPEVKGKVWSVWSGLHDFPRGKMTRDPRWSTPERANGGVCVSEDGGKTWRPTVEGMGMDSPATCIVLDPATPPANRTLYVSVYNKGVFKSIDDGKNWEYMNDGIETVTGAFELTLAANGDLFLVVCPTPRHQNGERGAKFNSGNIYKSIDGAKSWTKLNVTDGLLFPNGIAVDPHHPDVVYLACWADISLADLLGGDIVRTLPEGDRMLEMPGGIFKSEDGGNTWKSIFDDKQYVYDVTIDPYHAGRMYCNTFNGAAYRSDDSGKTWKPLKGYDFHWGHRVVVDENDHEKVFITTFGSSVWHGVPVVQ
jgi:photosystem II stability/assembly factor-like uncharacterized protein